MQKKQKLIYDVVATGQSVLSHCVCQVDQLHVGTLRLLRECTLRGLRGYHYHHHHNTHSFSFKTSPNTIMILEYVAILQ